MKLLKVLLHFNYFQLIFTCIAKQLRQLQQLIFILNKNNFFSVSLFNFLHLREENNRRFLQIPHASENKLFWMTFQITKEVTKLMNILAVIASFSGRKIKKREFLHRFNIFCLYLDYSGCRIIINQSDKKTKVGHSSKMRATQEHGNFFNGPGLKFGFLLLYQTYLNMFH